MDYQALKTELTKPEYEELSAAQCVEILNAPSGELYDVPVSSVDVATYLMENASSQPPLTLYNILSLTYRDEAYPDTVRAVAENIIDLATGVERPLALRDNPIYTAAFGAMVQAGRFTQDEIDAILDLGRRFKTKGEIAFGSLVSEIDVHRAWLFDKAAFARARAGVWAAAAESLESGVDVDLEGVS